MLYNLDRDPMETVPHRGEFDTWRARLSDAHYNAMYNAINNYCDRCEEVFCSTWLPGSDPAIEAAFPPLTVACGGNEELSGLFFGIIVWIVMMERNDQWLFKPAEQQEDRWRGVTYFRRGDSE